MRLLAKIFFVDLKCRICVVEYDRVKHEKCTAELGQYVFECAAQNIIDKQYSNRKSLSEEDCR